MSTEKTPRKVDREFVMKVGGHVLATQLGGLRDPSAEGDSHLDKLADLSVRAAMALDAAIPRAEERVAAEAKAAEEAEKAEADAKARVVAEAKVAANVEKQKADATAKAMAEARADVDAEKHKDDATAKAGAAKPASMVAKS